MTHPITSTTSPRPRRLAWLGVMFVSVFALLALAACGSSSDSPTKTTSAGAGVASTATKASGAASTVASVANTTVSGAASTVASAATQLSGSPDIAQFSGIALELSNCAQQNTTGQVITDLSAGKTDSAKQVYNDCVGTALPGPLASQAEPVVNDAVACSETAAKGMSATDMTAAENGDQAAITKLTNQTITCLLAKYGDLLK